MTRRERIFVWCVFAVTQALLLWQTYQMGYRHAENSAFYKYMERE